MDTIFTLHEDGDDTKINLDDLYEKKKQQDLNTIQVYNRLLKRIHTKIKTTSRMTPEQPFCWYVIPEFMIGIPKYDHGLCTAYIIDKLRDNSFLVKYIHPNLLFISWKHWIPSYVRYEFKKKTGIQIDEYGNRIDNNNEQDNNDPFNLTIHTKKDIQNIQDHNKKSNDYKDVNSYKPTGNLIYNERLFKNIEDKL